MTNKSQNDEDALFNRWLEDMTIQLTKEENKLNNNPTASVEAQRTVTTLEKRMVEITVSLNKPAKSSKSILTEHALIQYLERVK